MADHGGPDLDSTSEPERTDRPLWQPPASAAPAVPAAPAIPPPAGPPPSMPPASVHAPPPGAYPAPWGGMGWWDGARWGPMPVDLPTGYVEPYSPVAGIARAAQVLLGVVALIKAANLLVDLGRYGDAEQIAGASSIDDVFSTGALGAASLSLLATLTTIATAVVFLIWRYRVQQNLRGVMGVRGTKFTPGWSVGWWFVPIANLWKPKQAMDEAWLASDPDLRRGGTWASRGVAQVLHWWWAAWILSYLINVQITVRSSPYRVTASEVRFALAQQMLSLSLGIAAAVLAVLVIESITTRHRGRARALGLPAT